MSMPCSTGSNNTIKLCMEKNCCWMNFGCGLQKSPGDRILCKAANAEPSGEGIGAGKRVKQHKLKVQGPVCVGGSTHYLFPMVWMICGGFRSVYIPPEHEDAAGQLPWEKGAPALLPEGNPWDPSLELLLRVGDEHSYGPSLAQPQANTAEPKTQECSSLPFRQKSFQIFPCLTFILVLYQELVIHLHTCTIPRTAVLYQV